MSELRAQARRTRPGASCVEAVPSSPRLLEACLSQDQPLGWGWGGGREALKQPGSRQEWFQALAGGQSSALGLVLGQDARRWESPSGLSEDGNTFSILKQPDKSCPRAVGLGVSVSVSFRL